MMKRSSPKTSGSLRPSSSVSEPTISPRADCFRNPRPARPAGKAGREQVPSQMAHGGKTIGMPEWSRDWRNGAIVYQILVDRFSPPTDLARQVAYYQAPRRLRAWHEIPRRGSFLSEHQVCEHEIEFWGGDLAGVQSRLEYLRDLGVDVVYLNPIFEAFTNHKYDATDFHRVDAGFGDRQTLAAFAAAVHEHGMKLMLDGVFNHVGRRSPLLQRALQGQDDPHREFFHFTPASPSGYVGWRDVANLPELNLDSAAVRDFLYRQPDSVVQSYLRREGIDGWRLDVAFELGFRYLAEMTAAAHEAKPGSAVIGEIWNCPEDWYPVCDGVMNMHARRLLLRLLSGEMPAIVAADMLERMVADAGLDHLLKAWLVLDNHDTPRLVKLLPEKWQQRLGRVLQFTLPGTVCLYYGSEVGMDGGEDPECRAPMRWDLVHEENPHLQMHRQLIALRRQEPALRWGDFRRLAALGCLAFQRRTERVADTVVVIANPGPTPVQEFIQLRDSRIHDASIMRDLLSSRTVRVRTGFLELEVPAHDVLVLKVDTRPTAKGYSAYDRFL
jgi:cyclomaltodextrinase / maltogenic alpha-amylase / neopullulanase